MGTFAMPVYDATPHDFILPDISPFTTAANNNGVRDRPVLLRRDNKYLMAWWRDTGTSFLRWAVGSVGAFNLLSFSSFGEIKLPKSHSGSCYSGRPRSAPAVAADSSVFYLAVRQRTQRCASNVSGTFLARDDVFIFTSPDGIAWTLAHKRAGVPLDGHLGLAAKSDGTLLFIVVGSSSTEVKLFKNAAWTSVASSAVFSPARKFLPFALFRPGE